MIFLPVKWAVKSPNDAHGGLKMTTINVNDAWFNLVELDFTKEMNLQMKHSAVLKYRSLSTQPDEVEDMFLVVHYKLGNKS